jgi:hypothetical protein
VLARAPAAALVLFLLVPGAAAQTQAVGTVRVKADQGDLIVPAPSAHGHLESGFRVRFQADIHCPIAGPPAAANISLTPTGGSYKEFDWRLEPAWTVLRAEPDSRDARHFTFDVNRSISLQIQNAAPGNVTQKVHWAAKNADGSRGTIDCAPAGSAWTIAADSDEVRITILDQGDAYSMARVRAIGEAATRFDGRSQTPAEAFQALVLMGLVLTGLVVLGRRRGGL